MTTARIPIDFAMSAVVSMAFGSNPYRAPAWLPGGHAQTIWPVLRKPAPPAYRRERWGTPDGDFIDVDWLAAAQDESMPLVALFHGLEGSSASHYAAALMHALAGRGWAGAVPHFRGCSGEPNRLPRAALPGSEPVKKSSRAGRSGVRPERSHRNVHCGT